MAHQARRAGPRPKKLISGEFVVPLTGEHVSAAIQLLRDAMFRHSFKPMITCLTTSPRAAHMLGAIVYDRDLPGEDERA